MKVREYGLIAWAILCAMPFSASAATITLEAIDSGAYRANGLHNPTIQNYLTGQFNSEQRGFVVFDLSTVTGPISAATLRLFNPSVSALQNGYSSPDPTETLGIWSVATPAADVVLNTGGVATFDDLGSGSLYGEATVGPVHNGTVIEVALNDAAIADLNAATGSFVVGMALSTISGPSDQYVFGFTMAASVPIKTRELVVNVINVVPIPEPSTYALTAIGTIALLAAARIKRPRG